MPVARTVRSSAHAQTRPEPRTGGAVSSRPQLKVIDSAERQARGRVVVKVFGQVIEWTRTRSAPVVHVVVAVLFLAASLIGVLMLRTQMVSNSFETSRIESNIAILSQDVEDDQAKLDALIASLPEKAEQMGMQPQKGSLSIDLSGYQSSASEGGNAQ